MLSILHRLHGLDLSAPAVFAPEWTGEMTENALSCFPVMQVEKLRETLDKKQAEFQYLFEPTCPISGDPNPTNWGVRNNGQLVLFDWERFGYGTAALDLAITVPGLGDGEQFRQVARAYLSLNDETPERDTVEQLARDMAGAKLWTVVEYLSGYAEGTISDDAPVRWIVEQFERWVEGLG
jgi:thiamine kinase-like enzyme